jgi:uncharacterized protein
MINIYLTTNCNLRCEYCYVNHSDEINFVTDEILDKFLDVMDDINYFNKKKKIMILGGEPFLYPERIYAIKNKITERFGRHDFFVGSNLTIFNKEIFEDIEIIVPVSIDGTKESHDLFRKTKEKDDTYDLAWNNLVKLSLLKKEIPITYTFDPSHLVKNFVEFTKNIMSINDKTLFEIDIRPIIGSVNEGNYKELENECLRLTDFFLEEFNLGKVIPITMISQAIGNKNNQLNSIRASTCSLGDENFTIFPDGSFWPCPHYYIVNKRKIGNLDLENCDFFVKKIKELRVFANYLKYKFKNMPCDCSFEDTCNKVNCISEFEDNDYSCSKSRKLWSEILLKIGNYIFTNVGKENFDKMLLEINKTWNNGRIGQSNNF